MIFELCNLSLREANAFVIEHHRHHGPTRGHKFSIGAMLNGARLVGIAIVGRPVARHNDDGCTAEVTRVCSDGTPNVCSFLYSRAKRAAQALGYVRVLTYTLPEEGGASLRGAGWKCLGKRGGGSWSRASRVRADKAPTQEKLLWEYPL